MWNEYENRGDKTIRQTNITVLFAAIFSYIIYLSTTSFINDNSDYTRGIYIMSWLGILIGLFIIFTWKNITGMVFSPYMIFMLFFYLFNYGQCLMWAIGIHIPSEIGNAILFPGFGVASDSDIIRAQSITLISILMFHCGAVFCVKAKSRKKKVNEKRISSLEHSIDLKVIYYVCLFTSILVFPVTLYITYTDLWTAQAYGYRSLYYSEYARAGGSFSGILSKMFFPCIIGMLVGSRFNKMIRAYAYSIFTIYLVMNILAGDRGSWVYKLIILIWLSHFCYKQIKIKKFATYTLVSIAALYIVDVIVSLRNIGVTYDNIINSLSLENSPIISVLFEMGSSMKPTIILQKYNWDIWPYENSYLLAALAMVTNKTLYYLNIPFATIGSWFSQSYLGISYGAGFSIVAEALLNYGPYVAPLILTIVGYFISSLIYIDKDVNYKRNPLKILFSITTLHSFLTLTRGYFHYQLKDWFYGVLVLCFIIYIITLFLKKKQRNF